MLSLDGLRIERGRKFVFLYNLLVFSFGMLMAGFMSLSYLIAIFVFIGGIGVGGEFPLVDSLPVDHVEDPRAC